jgi:hypothetical protein
MWNGVLVLMKLTRDNNINNNFTFLNLKYYIEKKLIPIQW